MINFLEQINDEFKSLEFLDINSLEQDGKMSEKDTVVIIVDMVKGFYNEGALQNQQVKEIINPMVNLLTKVKDYNKIFFVDSHSEESIEFKSYPKHCVSGTSESEIVNELTTFTKDNNSAIIRKNSINGFHSNEFKKWVDKNEEINNFIIVGVCTDICVKNLAISLKTYFNEINQDKRIIIPKNMVETFDSPFHNRDFTNLISFYEMKSNGIEIVEEIR